MSGFGAVIGGLGLIKPSPVGLGVLKGRQSVGGGAILRPVYIKPIEFRSISIKDTTDQTCVQPTVGIYCGIRIELSSDNFTGSNSSEMFS